MRLIVKTYDVVTPESAEYGDVAEYGYADFRGNRYPIRELDGTYMEYSLIGHECEPDEYDVEDGLTAVDLAVKFLRDKCYVYEASSSDGYLAYPENDMQGNDTTYAYHLHGFSADEEQAIYARLFPTRS